MTPYQRGHRDALLALARRRAEALPHDPAEVVKDP